MDQESVSSLVRHILSSFGYELPSSAHTVGVPWSAEKVDHYVEQLKAALIEPYLQRFELRETYIDIVAADPRYAEYWVVAQGGSGYLEWYDPATGEFGLGIRGEGQTVPVSIGVRGDLVGVYCAM